MTTQTILKTRLVKTNSSLTCRYKQDSIEEPKNSVNVNDLQKARESNKGKTTFFWSISQNSAEQQLKNTNQMISQTTQRMKKGFVKQKQEPS